MEKKQRKYNQAMSISQTADFLRKMADGLEQGFLNFESETFQWDDISKIKLTFKNHESLVLVKTKLKGEPGADIEVELRDSDKSTTEEYLDELDELGELDENDENSLQVENAEPEISYKKLKKRMKKSFKAIHVDLKNGNMPQDQEMERFLEDCKLMTNYTGYGDEYYPVFNEAAEQMRKAWQANYLNDLTTAFQDMVKIMKVCHDRYK